VASRLERLRKNSIRRGKSPLHGPFVPQDKLKPIERTQFTSVPFEAQGELKHGPPEEKDFFRNLQSRCRSCLIFKNNVTAGGTAIPVLLNAALSGRAALLGYG
jgi:hypothetical protein